MLLIRQAQPRKGSSGPGYKPSTEAARRPAGSRSRPVAPAGYDPFSAPDVATGYDPYAVAPASPVEPPVYCLSPEALPPPPPQLQQQHGVAPGHGFIGQPGAGYDPFLEQPPVGSPKASPLPQPLQRLESWQRDAPPRLPGDTRPNAAGEPWPHSRPQRLAASAEQLPPWQRAGQGPSNLAPAHVAPTWPPPQTPQQSPPVPLQQMHRDPLLGPAAQHPQSRTERRQHDQHQAQPAPHVLGRMHRAQPSVAAGQVPMTHAIKPAPLWHQQPPPVYSPRGVPVPGAYGAPQRSYPAAEWGPSQHGTAPQQQQPGLRDARGGPPHLPQQTWPQAAPLQPQWDPGQVRARPWGPQPVPQQPLSQRPQHGSAPAPQRGPWHKW